MRKFEKISFKEFQKEICNDINLYEEYKLPKRATKCSAGYDFYAIQDYVLKPHEKIIIPTGYKATFLKDEVLFIMVRSSLGFKWNVRLTNQVGVVESDYYNNLDNEGHIFVSLQNEGSKEFVIKKGEAYVQGIFTKFLTTSDDDVNTLRTGGIGSTNKKEGKL